MSEARDRTEEALEALEKKISGVYKEAADDVSKTVNDYFGQFAEKDAAQLKLVESGELSKTEYTQWRLTQMGRGEKYKDLQNKLAERYTNANEVARSYVYDETPSIYSLNRNYSAYTIEQAGGNVNFNAWNERAVKNLIVNNPDLMPNYPEEKAFARGIDLAYGKERISACVTSGILQGNSPYQIADDLQSSLENMNRESAVRTARTAFTAAENAGNQDAFEEAEEMGLPLEKVWIATDDDRTREDHLAADGQVVPIDEPFEVGGEELMYPGDPDGEPEQIYNCRCTMIAHVEGVDTSDTDKWAKESFDEWEEDADDVLEDEEELAEEEVVEDLESEDTSDGYRELFDEEEADNFFHDSVEEWLEKTTPDEQADVRSYTNLAYGSINSFLRGERSTLPEFRAAQVDNITTALSKFEVEEDIVLYRHMTDEVFEMVKEGEIFQDMGFMSTSADAYLEGFGENVMEIHLGKGTGAGAWVSDISEYPEEQEFLFQRGSGFKVEKKGDYYAVAKFIPRK